MFAARRRILAVGWALMLVLFLLSLAAWVDSYCWCRQYLWGDRPYGNYTFVTSSFGALFLERRSNCDQSPHFTRNHLRSYRYGPHGSVISHELLGFGSYSGTRNCWYMNLYPVTTLPALSDPRWHLEPFRMARVPYWPAILLTGGVSLPFVPRCVRSWGARRRARRGLCRSCGYNLTGNVSGICPECGTAVKAAQRETPPGGGT